MPWVKVSLKCLKPKETDFEPKTLGDHLLRRRLALGLSQRQAATRAGVSPNTVLNWEKDHTKPPIESMPSILQFLGYDPFPKSQSLPERLLAKRRQMGWSIKEAALRLGIDSSTWQAWEQGQTILFQKHRTLVAQLLDLPKAELNQEMTTRWIHAHRRK